MFKIRILKSNLVENFPHGNPDSRNWNDLTDSTGKIRLFSSENFALTIACHLDCEDFKIVLVR
jgi:hypothetical protein